VACRADSEFANKRWCINAERMAQCVQALATDLTMTPPISNSVRQDQSATPIKSGQYVIVIPDLSTRKFSHGGKAWVKAIHGTGGGSTLCYVHYIKMKSHIKKTMVIAFTGYAFDKNIENGWHGLKIMVHCIKGAQIAKKSIQAGENFEVRQQVYNGEVVRQKGDVYMVDCNVTGSDAETSDKPKFLLKDFLTLFFPHLVEIVGPCGEYEGYVPIIQGNNAGPHQDKTLKPH
jgi:hypothetical protein